MKRTAALGFGGLGVGIMAAAAIVALAGPLNPPAGPVASTYKTLTDVEPRIAVQTLAGNATAQYVISQPGSFYLTGNIQGVVGKHGIQITSGDVTLDLAGFAMVGPGGSGNFDGINLPDPPTVDNVSISNGVVRGWPRHGVNAVFGAANCQFRDMRAYGNVGDGFRLVRATVSDCVSQFNGGNGFTIYESTVRNCAAYDNAGNGVTGFFGAVLSNCVARFNGWGIYASDGAVVKNCMAQNNTNDGVLLGNYAVALESESDTNGRGFAIFSGAAAGVRIESCTASRNTGKGFDLTGGTGCILVRNTARANAGGNYTTAAGNSWGPIVTASGDLSTVTGANHPQANFSY